MKKLARFGASAVPIEKAVKRAALPTESWTVHVSHDISNIELSPRDSSPCRTTSPLEFQSQCSELESTYPLPPKNSATRPKKQRTKSHEQHVQSIRHIDNLVIDNQHSCIQNPNLGILTEPSVPNVAATSGTADNTVVLLIGARKLQKDTTATMTALRRGVKVL